MRTMKLLGGTALALVLVACGSDDNDGNNGNNGSAVNGVPNVLVKGSQSNSDPGCPNGSVKLDLGSDKNGNGQLDDDEITGTNSSCSPGQAPVLTTVKPTGPSQKCTNGGTTVTSGADANGNGKLDDNEVSSTVEICSGGTSVELSKTKHIDDGDERCPFGGLETRTGLDNGKDGAEAGDGVLQEGEVLKTTIVCVSGAVGSLAPPEGKDGDLRLIASGGDGSAGNGGNAGLINVGTFLLAGDGMLGGNVKIFRSGDTDVDYDPPSDTPNFGAVKLDVTANTTIASYASSANAADGEYYTLNNSGLYYRENAGNPQVPVTGVHVAKNVTLTFPAAGISFTLSDDFQNEGTLTTEVTAGSHGNIQMVVAYYFGGEDSKVDLAGAAVAGAAGGNGGSFAVNANRYHNEGRINTSGADGDATGTFAGGNAGNIVLGANLAVTSGPLYQSGSLKADGGSGKAAGGNGGTIQTITSSKTLYIDASIDQSGGKGGTNGGNAGAFIGQSSYGDAIYNGLRTARGGGIDEAACAGACTGGIGGNLTFVSVAGNMGWNADNDARSGDSFGAAGPPGATAVLIDGDGPDPVFGGTRPAGNIHLSGTFDSHGSDGTVGGPGGSIFIAVYTSIPNGQEVELRGYESIRANGGDGTTGGGNAGAVYLLNRSTSGNRLTGGLVVQPEISVNGGKATVSGPGGNAGLVQFTAGAVGTPKTNSQVVLLGGSVEANGGDGFTFGGVAGVVQLESGERAYIYEDVTLHGGNASGAGGTAGATQGITWRAPDAFGIDGEVSIVGGNATGAAGAGGSCASFTVLAGALTADSAITCGGGNSNGAAGGNGGNITLTSSFAPTIHEAVTAPGGTGTPNGTPGVVIVDGNPL